MFSKKAITLSALAAVATADQVAKRQADSEEAFSSAAADLITSYIPEDIYSSLLGDIGSAASEAGVTGEPSDIVFSVMTAGEAIPTWFSEAVPEEYWTQIEALDEAVGSFDPDFVPAVPTTYTTEIDGEEVTTSGFVVSVTTEDDDGNTTVMATITDQDPNEAAPEPTRTTAVVTDENGSEVTTTGYAVTSTSTDDEGNETTATGITDEPPTQTEGGDSEETNTDPDNAGPTVAAGRGVAVAAGLVGIAALL